MRTTKDLSEMKLEEMIEVVAKYTTAEPTNMETQEAFMVTFLNFSAHNEELRPIREAILMIRKSARDAYEKRLLNR